MFSTPFHKQLDPSKQAGQAHPGRVEQENLELHQQENLAPHQAIERAKRQSLISESFELRAGTPEDWEDANAL